ncbi:Calx-beta domain-containing protein, partial [Plebeiibacterium sediminum]
MDAIFRKNTFILSLFLLCFITINGQTPGLIYEPATGFGSTVLDPNGDGYVSVSSTGFTSAVEGNPGNDVPEFENASEWHNFPTIGSGEVLRDIRSGPDEGFTDFSVNDQGTATYYRFDGNNMVFRFRLADYRPNSKGYTVLIDTDSKFGNDDPEYSSENPGFELAIVLQNKQDVFIYDINTGSPGCTPTILHSYIGGINHQKAISGIQDDGDLDFFYDFYVPIADMGITASTTLRMAATTNTSNSYTFCGSVSDVGGVDDGLYGDCLECLFTDLIEGQIPTSPDNTTGFPAVRTDCPRIDGTIFQSDTEVSGTTTEISITEIQLYINGVLEPGATTTITGGGVWIISGLTLTDGDVISATATASGKSVSFSDCSEIIVGAGCDSPVPTVLGLNAGKGIGVHYSGSVGDVITVYSDPAGTIPFNESNLKSGSTNPHTIIANDWNTNEYYFEFECQTGNCFPDGTYYISAGGGCELVEICLGGTVENTLTLDSPITSDADIISGGNGTSGNTLYLKVNGRTETSTTLSASGFWNFNHGLELNTCDYITVTQKGLSCASANSNTVYVAPKVPIVYDIDCVDGPLTTVSGYSAEQDGTVITVYDDGIALTPTTSVENNQWTLTGVAIATGSSVYATATNNSCGAVSENSNIVTVTQIPTNTGLSISSDPVYNYTTALSGSCNSSATDVKIYIDEIYLADALISGNTWILNPVPAGELYEGGKIQVTQAFGGCESSLSTDFKIVQCSSVPGATTLLPYSQTCNDISNSSINIEVSGVEFGYIYTLIDEGGNDFGYSQFSNGISNLTLASIPLPLSPDPSKISVRAEKLNPGIDCSVDATNTLSIDLNPHMTVLGSTNIPATCTAEDGSITITGLGVSASYELSYVRNGGNPITSTITSEADGTYTITGLSNGSYTDITMKNTTNDCTSPAISETLNGGGTSSTLFPVIAEDTSVSSGETTNIFVGDASNSTNVSYTYYLYNRDTNSPIASSIGNGGILSLSTGVLSETTKFYVYVDEGTGSCVTFTTEPIVTITTSLPTVAFNTTFSSGAESLSSADLQVDLSSVSSQDVMVEYTVTGTATGSGIDYTLANGTLTIIAGSTSANITIASIINDAIYESDETVIVTLSYPTNAILGTNSYHTYTITDDDGQPAISINDASVTEGNSGTATLDFTVSLNHASTS